MGTMGKAVKEQLSALELAKVGEVDEPSCKCFFPRMGSHGGSSVEIGCEYDVELSPGVGSNPALAANWNGGAEVPGAFSGKALRRMGNMILFSVRGAQMWVPSGGIAKAAARKGGGWR